MYYESVIDKKEESIIKLHDELMKLRDDVRTKDDALKDLSQKIIEKAEKN